MKDLLKFFLLIFVCILFPPFAVAQENPQAEKALEQANKHLSEKNFEQAIEVLKPFEDVAENAGLLGKTYYWNGNIAEAKKCFTNALSKFPDSLNLQLDYGRMLYELWETEEAIKVLSTFLEEEPDNIEANLYLGYMVYKSGDYQKSKKYFDAILKSQPKHGEALNMLAALQNLLSWNIETGVLFQTDNQPLQLINPFVGIKKHQNQWLFPELKFNSYFFDTEGTKQKAHKAEVGNTFSIQKAGLEAYLSAGVFSDHIDGAAHWVGSASVKKKIAKSLTFQASWARQPVFFAASSLKEVVKADDYSVVLELDKPSSWSGQAGFQHSAYFDDNAIQTTYLWFLTPPLKVKDSQWKIGYAGAYSDVGENRFVNSVSKEELLQNWVPDMEIPGVYAPYFTPQNQIIHSFLATSQIRFTKALSLNLNANVGVVAVSDIPYLYFDEGVDGVEIVRETFREQTTNLELKAEAACALSDAIKIKSECRYSDNFFYRANTYMLKVNWMLNGH